MSEQEILNQKMLMFRMCLPKKFQRAAEQLHVDITKVNTAHKAELQEVRDESLKWWSDVMNGEVKYFKDAETKKIFKIMSVVAIEEIPLTAKIIEFVNHK